MTWLVFASQFCTIWTTIVYKYSSGYHTGQSHKGTDSCPQRWRTNWIYF